MKETLETKPRFSVGQSCTKTLLVSDELVHAYADVTGDRNPVHLDDAFAAKTPFHRRIAHGGIAFGLVSKVLGNDLPGVGTIFKSQAINFRAPVYPGDTLTFQLNCSANYVALDGAFNPGPTKSVYAHSESGYPSTAYTGWIQLIQTNFYATSATLSNK